MTWIKHRTDVLQRLNRWQDTGGTRWVRGRQSGTETGSKKQQEEAGETEDKWRQNIQSINIFILLIQEWKQIKTGSYHPHYRHSFIHPDGQNCQYSCLIHQSTSSAELPLLHLKHSLIQLENRSDWTTAEDHPSMTSVRVLVLVLGCNLRQRHANMWPFLWAPLEGDQCCV